MRLDATKRARLRTTVTIGGCLAVAVIAVPGIATAGVKAVQEVIVTNTIQQPVPVVPQGPTEVTGTVTVGGQPEPVQISQVATPVSRENPVATETLYTVPEGKLLTVEYAELYFWNLAAARRVYLFVDCDGGNRTEGPIDSGVHHLPEIDGGDDDRIFGGPMKLQVPAGRCLRSNVVVVGSDLEEDTTVYVHGTVTGYLSDLPAAAG